MILWGFGGSLGLGFAMLASTADISLLVASFPDGTCRWEGSPEGSAFSAGSSSDKLSVEKSGCKEVSCDGLACTLFLLAGLLLNGLASGETSGSWKEP